MTQKCCVSKKSITFALILKRLEEHEEVFEGIRSRIIQHEYDHLQGHVHVDRIAPLRKTLLQGKLRAIAEGKCDVDYRMIFPRKKKHR